jgi:transcriptional regulator with XRE-family HTH domain
MQGGLQLRQARERLGLTYRDVEQASHELAARRSQREFIIRISRLADIENHGVVPGIHKLFALCTIYHLDLFEALSWFGLPVADMFRDGGYFPGPRTHLAAAPLAVRLPVRIEPGFDPRKTDDFTRRVESWGYLEPGMMNGNRKYCLAYVGLEDRTMDPLIRPGSLLLVDPTRNTVSTSPWTNEFDRPVYFVDARIGYCCAWCQRSRESLILQPHPLSHSAPQVLRCPEEAEIIGQVVALSMRLHPA